MAAHDKNTNFKEFRKVTKQTTAEAEASHNRRNNYKQPKQ